MLINLAGDVMIGRLIDQLLPTSVHNPEEAKIVQQFRLSRTVRYPYLAKERYNYSTIWGNTLSLWKEGNLNIINLETSVTTHDKLWPNKVFNYRTHPENLNCLTSAHIHHVSLANNHTLDFDVKGLEQTCESLDQFDLSYVGAGKTRSHALGPIYLDISPSSKPVSVEASTSRSSSSIRVGLISASDHPSDWSRVSSFHFFDYHDRSVLSSLIITARSNADFVICSIHWGPNYQWRPERKIRELAHWMINEGVDVIHGHSSHHIQGIELFPRQNRNPALIIYGCGDFLDDYAIDEQYRNDLSALFRLNLSISTSESDQSKFVSIHSLSIYPTRCSNFQVNRLDHDDADWKWIKDKLTELSDLHDKTWIVGENHNLVLRISS
ncbi:unnamed protein product [Adineta ricciae]|uniref:Capsule synthesis protein CapA domain-containing protein n=1 Tax=Adineta ricciae TaxID=249248 RepID=A0A816F0K9_ADIRI|nr:unnamed protein product [Adineta ricciae]